MPEVKIERYDVLTPGVKEKFLSWIKDREGVIVWRNQEIGHDRGDMFTPATTPDGKDGTLEKPHWAFTAQEVITDAARFRFVKEMREVARCKIALNKNMNGLKIMLTIGSSNRVKKLCADLKEKHGEAPTYHFEELEAVFEIPVWEE